MNNAKKRRPVERASVLLAKFEKNPRMNDCAVFKDKSDFLLKLPTNSQKNRVSFKGQKNDVSDKRFLIKQIDNVFNKSVRSFDIARGNENVIFE